MNYAILGGLPANGYHENDSGMRLSQLSGPASTILAYESSPSTAVSGHPGPANSNFGIDTNDPSASVSGYASGNAGDIDNRHDSSAITAQTENYLAADGHVKYVRLPSVSIYNAVPPMVSCVRQSPRYLF